MQQWFNVIKLSGSSNNYYYTGGTVFVRVHGLHWIDSPSSLCRVSLQTALGGATIQAFLAALLIVVKTSDW